MFGLFRGGFGLPEIILVLFIVLLLFGATRLPQLAKSMGSAIKEFRKAAGPSLDEGAPDTTTRRTRSKKA
ncbi:MAG: twin-arginine translocase TatA/TatE family subunit [Chloroflexi bacterium]|nr:twin-arginine translocase TatA/TatE family subunit [Chloroflexota bacterium]